MPLAFEPYELTADFVVGLDQYALDDARLALASTIRRFEERFEAVNGRKPTRQARAARGARCARASRASRAHAPDASARARANRAAHAWPRANRRLSLIHI